jgi:hypothetical protein
MPFIPFSGRPDCERAYAFETFTCGDPECGVHIVAQRATGKPICEMIIGRDGARNLRDYIDDEVGDE